MTSVYSTTYHLRRHKRDDFIEFIKSLLLTPFILHTRPSSGRQTSTTLSAANSFGSLFDGRDAPFAVAARLTSGSSADDDRDGESSSKVRKRTVIDRDDVAGQPDMDKNVARYCEVLECIESLIVDHMVHQASGLPELSRLSQLVPTVGMFFTPLPLRDSFLIINKTRSIAGRRNVPPSFNDIRHLLNLSQVTAIAPTLNLITFDGDMTLYADGADFSRDSELVELIVRLLRNDINVAIVTAAGYPRDPTRYEQRLTGLLDGIRELNLTPLQKSRFFVLGGECNYLFRYDPETDHLKYIPEAEYQPDDVRRWSTSGTEISRMLDAGEACAEQSCEEMGIKDRVKIIRKERAVGIIGQGDKPLSREQLDEIALAIQRRLNNYQHARRERWIRRQPATLQRRLSRDHFQALRHSSHGIGGADVDVAVDDEEGDDAADFIPIPFCAFNGGSDVWLDIGNKLIGVKILQDVVKVKGDQTLHVGDQFLSTGNDILTRSCATTVWITSPSETAEVLQQLHDEIDKAGRAGKRTKT